MFNAATATDPYTDNNTDNTDNGGTTTDIDLAVIKVLDDDATNVLITDTPNDSLEIVSVSSDNCTAFPCTLAFMANGDSEIITVSARIILVGEFSNSAEVSSDLTDPIPDNNTDFVNAVSEPVMVPALSHWSLLLLALIVLLFATTQLGSNDPKLT